MKKTITDVMISACLWGCLALVGVVIAYVATVHMEDIHRKKEKEFYKCMGNEFGYGHMPIPYDPNRIISCIGYYPAKELREAVQTLNQDRQYDSCLREALSNCYTKTDFANAITKIHERCSIK